MRKEQILTEKNIKLFDIINNTLEDRDYKYTYKLLEKQFGNNKILYNWLNRYDKGKLALEDDDTIFGMEICTVIKILLFFKTLNLLNDNNIELIESVIENVEVFIQIFNNSFLEKLDKYDNIIDNCKDYILFNHVAGIIDNKIDSIKNTVGIDNSIKSDLKNTVQIKKLENENIYKDKLEITDSRNTVDNKSKNIDSDLSNIKIIDISKKTGFKNTVEINSINNKSENTVNNNNIDLQNTVDDKNENKETVKKRRNKYNKTNKLEIVKKTVNNIISYKINNTELYEQIYKFNRSNINLFSNIYVKYKINPVIDETEFNNIYINFDKNKNRFLKICKIYYEISKEDQLINSNLLFLPYCFNDISIKDDCINRFKVSIIEFLNNKKE